MSLQDEVTQVDEHGEKKSSGCTSHLRPQVSFSFWKHALIANRGEKEGEAGAADMTSLVL